MSLLNIIVFSKDQLYQKYWLERKSLAKIAKEFSCSPVTVLNHMRKHGVPTRSKAFRGKKRSKKAKLNYSASWSPERKKAQAERLKGKRPAMSFAGKTHSTEWKSELSKRMSGENNPMFGRIGEKNPNWKPAAKRTSELHKSIRNSLFYKTWRTRIFERDNYTCQHCFARGGNLNADHIKPFARILKENNVKTKEEAFEISALWDASNGRTLCYDCHRQTDTWGIKTC